MRSGLSESPTSFGVATRSSTSSSNAFCTATYIVSAVAGCLSAWMLTVEPLAAVFIAAILFGWSELNGLCGASHVGTLTPFRALDDTGATWLRAVCAYTAAGVVTASIVGALTGLFGRFLVSAASDTYLYAISGGAAVLAARELGCIRFALPQVHRQTHKMWQFEFGIVTGASMWGAHIGLGIATVIAHGGFLILLAFAVTLGPLLGAILMVVYWCGRTLPLWLGPSLSVDPARGASIAECVMSTPRAYEHAAAVGLIATSIAMVIMALRNG